MTNKLPQQAHKKKYYNLAFYTCVTIFLVGYYTIIVLGYKGLISEPWIGRIDIICLLLGLLTYTADTSGMLEKKPNWLPVARAITLATLLLSLSIHIFTQANMIAHFNWFIALAWIVVGLVIAWGIRTVFAVK